jgi:molecular chaperone GrpE (heat shock protein)
VAAVAEKILVSDEFAAAMQQLSAEAAKTIPDLGQKGAAGSGDFDRGNLSYSIQALTARFETFEQAITKKLDQLATSAKKDEPPDLTGYFEKIQDKLEAIQSSETVNHRLFDSLHSELLTYRDNFLHESLQKPFIHDLVHLYDDLTSLSDQLKSASSETKGANALCWRDNLDNAIHSLIEILHRFEVKEIEPKDVVDRTIHKVLSYEPADYAEEEGRIVMRVRRGFVWRGKLIRPEEVIAKRFN